MLNTRVDGGKLYRVVVARNCVVYNSEEIIS